MSRGRPVAWSQEAELSAARQLSLMVFWSPVVKIGAVNVQKSLYHLTAWRENPALGGLFWVCWAAGFEWLSCCSETCHREG